MSKRAVKTVEVVYENGVFRPTSKLALPNRSRFRLTLVPVSSSSAKAERQLVTRQRKALLSLAGIARSGRRDISENPHEALYGTGRAR